MLAKLLCYLIFILIETVIILGSIVVVLCYYLPMVALKGVAQSLSGKASLRTEKPESSPGTQT